ncbi:MAG: polysaccharide deacetylase family protein [Phycisphaerales bacterium]|nr:polysaccharide deacetylase family protein [Phycisphaerales bacterium]
MHPSTFEKTVLYLLKRYEIINLEETILGNRKINKKTLAAITFDDGYKDILQFAAPFLQSHNIPFSVNVITDCVNNQIPPWTYIIDYILTHSQILENNISAFLPDQFAKNNWKDVNERIEFAKKLKPFLKTTNNKFRKEIVNECIEYFDDVQLPSNLMLDWDDIIALRNSGVSIGSHSHTHPLLNSVEKDSKIMREFEISRNILYEKLNEYPLTISYPVGSVNERIKKIAQESGYKIGLAVQGKTYKSHIHDQFEIPRIELYEESMFKLRLRARGKIQPIKKIFNFFVPDKLSKL